MALLRGVPPNLFKGRVNAANGRVGSLGQALAIDIESGNREPTYHTRDEQYDDLMTFGANYRPDQYAFTLLGGQNCCIVGR